MSKENAYSDFPLLKDKQAEKVSEEA